MQCYSNKAYDRPRFERLLSLLQIRVWERYRALWYAQARNKTSEKSGAHCKYTLYIQYTLYIVHTIQKCTLYIVHTIHTVHTIHSAHYTICAAPLLSARSGRLRRPGSVWTGLNNRLECVPSSCAQLRIRLMGSGAMPVLHPSIGSTTQRARSS